MWNKMRRKIALRRRLRDRRYARHVGRLGAWIGDVSLYPLLHAPWFRRLGVRTIIDIGANTGQFSKLCRFVMPTTHIIAFEPLPDCFIGLESTFAQDQHFTVFNLALGEQAGEATFHRNDFTPSSSLLELAPVHKEAFPFAASTSDLAVPVRRLDDVVNPDNVERPILVKMDVQGFEGKVVRGGANVLAAATIVVAEVSFAQLYYGQTSFVELHDLLGGLGLRFAGAVNPLSNSNDGRIISQDCIFLRD